jgi:hypothetical protein
MHDWAERQLGRKERRARGPLTLLQVLRSDPSTVTAMGSEPLIPRRGGWIPRRGEFTQVEESPVEQTDTVAAHNAARVRWNLTA